jgi:hemolysin activation/secretion protein
MKFSLLATCFSLFWFSFIPPLRATTSFPIAVPLSTGVIRQNTTSPVICGTGEGASTPQECGEAIAPPAQSQLPIRQSSPPITSAQPDTKLAQATLPGRVAPPEQPLIPPRPDLKPLPITPPAPPPTPPLETPAPTAPKPLPPTEARILVKKINVQGSTIFSKAELARAVRKYENQELTFEQLLQIRTDITKLYVDRGYTTSGAFLPPQDLNTGIITIQVIEGGLERIEILGLRRLRQSYVRKRIELAAKKPLNILRLETALQLLQLDPLFTSVRAELKAGTAPGRSVLTLNLKEAQPFHGILEVENRDSPSVGEIRGTFRLFHGDLLGFGDRLSLEYGLTEGIRSYDFGYEIPINARDGTVSLRYTRTNSRIVEPPFSVLDITSTSETFSVGVRQPLRRTPTNEFALGLTFDIRQSQTFLLKQPFSFSLGPDNGLSQVRVLRFSQDWISRNARRVLAARSQFSVGLPIFNATRNDTGADGRFFSWVGQFQWVESLGGGAISIARVAAQLTPNPLLPLEQFSIGGVETVRGYRQNQRVGDNGVAGSLEIRVPIARDDRIGVIQLAPFFDIGTIWNSNSLPISSPRTLLSTGIGLRWQFDPYFSLRLDYGIQLAPIAQQGNSLQDKGIYFFILVQPF